MQGQPAVPQEPSTPARPEIEANPVVWFAALQRGVEAGNARLEVEAQARLLNLGWIVIHRLARQPKGGGQ